jgi:hypothetical protein
MRHPNVVLNDMVSLGLAQRLLQTRRLFGREAIIDAGTADIDAALDRSDPSMGAVIGIAR